MIINKENIDAILFDYAEGNLTASERQQVEAYLLVHKEDKQKLDLYDSNITIDKPTMVFDDKQSLYDIAKTTRPNIIVISKYIKWITATAAALTLIIGIKTFYSAKQPVQIAKTSPKVETSSSTTSPITHIAQIITHTNSAITHTNSAIAPQSKTDYKDTSSTVAQDDILLADIIQDTTKVIEDMEIVKIPVATIEKENEDLIAQNDPIIEDNQNTVVIIKKTNETEQSNKEKPNLLELIKDNTHLDEITYKVREGINNVVKLVDTPLSRKIFAKFGDRDEEVLITKK